MVQLGGGRTETIFRRRQRRILAERVSNRANCLRNGEYSRQKEQKEEKEKEKL